MGVPVPLMPFAWGARVATRKFKTQRAKKATIVREEKRWEAIESRLNPSAQVEPEAAPARLTAARSWTFKRRRELAPVVVGLVLVGAWFVVHIPAAWSWLSLVLAGGPLLAVAAGGYWWVRQIAAGSSQGARRRVAASAAVVGSLLWLASPAHLPVPAFWKLNAFTLTVLPDLPWHLRWAVLSLGAALAVWARWGRFTVRTVSAVESVGPVEIWAAKIGCDGGRLPGTTLAEFRSLNAASWEARMLGVRGKFGAEELRNAVNTIAGVYGCKPAWIEVVEQDDYAEPLIRLTQKATLATSKPWRPGGFNALTGVAEIGTYPDGSRSCFAAHIPGQGVRHFWITGGTGTGKSSCVSAFLGRIMQFGVVVLDLADLGETSLPAWMKKAFRSGVTQHDGLMTLRRANAVMDDRKAAMRKMPVLDAEGEQICGEDGAPLVGISTLPISEEWPVYLALMEEWPEMLGITEAVQLADRIGRLGRKYGVAIGVVTQGADLNAAFKGCDGLRKNIQQGNVMGLRADKDSGQMAFGGAVKVNLGAIPSGQPGLGFVLSPVAMRDITSRVDHVDDDPNRPAGVPSSWEVAAHAIPGTPNPVDLAAVERVEREEAERQAERAKPVEEQPADTEGISRATVERALIAAVKEASGGPVMLAAVAKKLGVDGMDELERKRAIDLIGKHLKSLANDPGSPAMRPGPYGQYGVAS